MSDEAMTRGRTARLIEVEIKPASLSVTLEVLREDREYKQRDKCTVCRKPQQWFELEPGTGRCTTCQP